MPEFLSLRGIHKSFVGVYALKGVDFDVHAGEVHCLIGENGSGKSTLIKIISGVLRPDSGQIYLAGQKVDHTSSLGAISQGVQVIYQDLSLFPNLTVAENIALGQLAQRDRATVDWGEVRRIAAAATARIKVQLDLDARLGDLPIGLQQLVAICRALTRDVKLLILDEPTASLGKHEIDSLLAVVRDLEASGIAVLFVSHKLNEVFAVAERITVLRDGEIVATLPPSELTQEKLVTLMTGRALQETRFRPTGGPGRKLLEVRGLTKEHNFADVSFDLHAGEILGLTGLIGSGRTELAQALFGIAPADSGEIRVEGRPVRIRSVRDAVRAGIAYVPENRLVQGLVMRHSVRDNVVAAVLRRLRGRLGLIAPRTREAVAANWVKALGIRVAHPSVPVQTLSGGNQQRVVIAKWLATEPKILILDSPTVGVDVMAKAALHGLVRDLAGRGMGVLLISDEFPEIVNNSSRVLLMRAGRLREELPVDGLEPDALQAKVEARR